MADKRITTELVVKAVDQYSGMIRNMSGVTGRFASNVRSEMGRLQNLRGPLRLIEDFRRQQQVVRASGETLNAARERVRQLQHAITTTRNPTARMRREFERARTAAARLEEKHAQHRRTLGGLQGQMRSAGVNTADLAGEQRRLTTALGAANTAFARQAERMQRLKVMQDRITAGRAQMDRALARSANLSFVGNASMATGRRMLSGLAAPVMQAVEFESAMSDVRKVVDFESPAAFRAMSDDIMELSTRIPIAATGLAEIVAAGGQSGIAQDDLARFAEMAAKIGVAFDISAGQSGEAMASIKTAMALDLDQTGSLFDAMNHLSNNSAARADQTLQFLNRAGADGANFGFDSNETLAIGAAMIAAGAGADTAATSFRNMGRALVRGEGATDRQSAAMTRLGLNSADVARAMQEDAVGTTMDVMQRLNELPDHLRATVMSDLFGDEARELTKLMNNMQLMPDMLALVADETQYLGSAEAEYAERSRTTANNMQLLRNQTTRLGVSIGEVVLPPLNDLLAKSQVFIDKMVTWTKEHPKLTKWLVISGVALGGMAIAGGAMLTAAAGLIGTLAVLRFGLVGLGARAIFAGGGLANVVGRFGMLRRLPRFRLSSLVAPLRWTARLIPAIGWSAMAGRLGRFGMNASGWGRLITPLRWFGRGALRLIPVIGWAVMAAEIGMFAWRHLGLSELPWRDYLNTAIEWKDWFFNFEWVNLLPTWDWTAIIPLFNMAERLFFDEAPSSLSSNPAEVAASIRRGTSLAYGQQVTPTAGARATGGPVQGGLPYLVNENTSHSEIMVPSQSGAVLNVSQAQAALRGSVLGRQPAQRGAQRIRSAGLAALATSALVGAPAALAAGGAPSAKPATTHVEIGSISIVAPSGVSDPEGLVDLIEARVGERLSATIAASFSD
ncbi:phage tail tape measure protein [Yoonia sp. I 8.24]|uniref:phage tail tape measure protein n=1 Tax=Yoonia sp. I 8.24 TaxID=1537229 RepID=UPI001EDE8A04|nr:phage tail tape measure protein [Yoonia sp. I 8.24]MCG3266122.1 phage tail tape measure protein [Yoonia sp. I 8.24]